MQEAEECSPAVSWTGCGATLLRLLHSHRVKMSLYKGAALFPVAFLSLHFAHWLSSPGSHTGLYLKGLTQFLYSPWQHLVCAIEVRTKTPHSIRGNKQSVLRAGAQLAFWYPEGRSVGNFKGKTKVNAVKNPLRDGREEE